MKVFHIADLQLMSAIIAGGRVAGMTSAKFDSTPEEVARYAVRIAKAICDEVEKTEKDK